MKFWKKPPPIKLIEIKIAHGFTAYGDDFVFEYFWNLYTFTDGSRKVVPYQCGSMKKNSKMDLSAKPRIDAWENGAPISYELLIDFDSLEKSIESHCQFLIAEVEKP